MNVALWVAAVLLALIFLASGVSKHSQPPEKLIARGYGWAEDFSPTQIKLIGVAEVLGATGLILPAALGIQETLTPLAAAGLALLMAGAAVVHIQRKEFKILVSPLVLGGIGAVLAALRLGPYGF